MLDTASFNVFCVIYCSGNVQYSRLKLVEVHSVQVGYLKSTHNISSVPSAVCCGFISGAVMHEAADSLQWSVGALTLPSAETVSELQWPQFISDASVPEHIWAPWSFTPALLLTQTEWRPVNMASRRTDGSVIICECRSAFSFKCFDRLEWLRKKMNHRAL